jgi:hypothetical protein
LIAPPIDVWNAASFDPELIARLTPHANLIVDYYRRNRAIFLSHDLGRGQAAACYGPRTAMPPPSKDSGRG